MSIIRESTDVLKVHEKFGVPSPAVASGPPTDLPPSLAQWPISAFQTKVGLINYLSRSYRWTFDQAVLASREMAVKMLNDLVIIDALYARIIPTTQLAWHVEAYDETDPAEVDGAKTVSEVLDLVPRWADFLHDLLFAIWYGRSGSMLLYTWDYSRPDSKRRLLIKDHRPMNGDGLVARWDGSWGSLVNWDYDGEKEISDGRGYAHFYTPDEMQAVIIHTHTRRDVDYYEPSLAGAIRGQGVRNDIFYYWYLKSNYLAILSDYSERFANGIWQAFYDESNPTGKADMEQAVASYRNNRVLSIPRQRDKSTAYGVEITEVGTATPQFLLSILESFDDLITRYITGSLITEKTDAIGGDVAGLVSDRITRVIKWDAVKLAATLTEQLLPVLYKYNCPGVRPGKFVFDLDSPNAGDILGYAERLAALGGNLDMDHLYSVCGLPQGGPGANISSKLQPMSPTAAVSTPQGVPIAGQPVQPAAQATPTLDQTTPQMAA